MIGWLFLFGMVNPFASCQALKGPLILGEDLAGALPAFSSIPGDVALGYSPAPGMQKRFTSADLTRIGRRYGIAVPPDSQACFEWKLEPLTADAVTAAIRGALQEPEARVDVLAINPAMTPKGKLAFAASGLSASSLADPTTPVTWRGQISYGGSRELSVWVRVRVAVTSTRVVATEDLLPEQVVTSRQVRLETYDDFPLKNEVARNLDEVVGKVTRRPLRAGLPVRRMDLANPLLVQRGETVQVTVICGAAEIRLDALADTSGRQGDMVSLTNPQTGKIFRARVEGKDKVIMLTGSTGLLARVQ